MKELLKIRNAAKAKKPTFLKQDAHRLAKLSIQWRQPKGQHSKIRKKLRSYRRQPSMGFSSPKAVRGLTRDGHELIVVHNISELEGIKTPVVIGSSVGNRKRVEIIKKCNENKIEVLNIKDVNAYTKNIEDAMKKKKDELKKRHDKRAKKEEEKKKEKESKEKKKESDKKESDKKEVTVEDTKKTNEEKKKILEKKN
ncbi:hypothetical protein HOF78_02655 [Candidatus Woesearchaeota archaeon]|nr:hypothetical protein [Candidatus Woesearchaeota archaeon]MBT6044941.1 hypothetical protein [Candidatus Woesearchaeota archaeon]